LINGDSVEAEVEPSSSETEQLEYEDSFRECQSVLEVWSIVMTWINEAKEKNLRYEIRQVNGYFKLH
jgi:hypothetical protein